MGYVLTLVSSDNSLPLTIKHFNDLEKVIAHYDVRYTSQIIWLDKSKAGEICLSSDVKCGMIEHLRTFFEKDRIDFFITKNEKRQKKLLIADMESTIIQNEMLDDLAETMGIQDQIAPITARAMNGELDFRDALRERLALLKGLDFKTLKTKRDNIKPNPGARTLIATMRKNDALCVLVSGGFTFFAEHVAKQCNFNNYHANVLGIENDKLDGTINDPILDNCAKVNFLIRYTNERGLNMENCLAIGDGANDLPMLKMAGLGIGYHPKALVKKEVPNCILYGDLTAALYAQGYSSLNFTNTLEE